MKLELQEEGREWNKQDLTKKVAQARADGGACWLVLAKATRTYLSISRMREPQMRKFLHQIGLWAAI